MPDEVVKTVEEKEQPPAPQLEVTWINELRTLLTEIRDQVGALAKPQPADEKKEPADTKEPPAPSALEAKIDKMIALLESKETRQSQKQRSSFLTRAKR